MTLPTVDWDRHGSRPRFNDRLDLTDPELYPLRASRPQAEFPVIHLDSAVITSRQDAQEVRLKDARVDLEDQPGVLHAALVDREGGWISRALVSGFAENLDGLASTYNTTTHILVLGKQPEAMARASQRVRELDGGIVVVQADEITYELALPITGMASELPFAKVVEENRKFSRIVTEAGYEFHDILYTLLFLTNDFLPALRLTPLGLLDVKSSSILVPAETSMASNS